MILLGIPYSLPSLNDTASGGTPYGVTHVSGVANDRSLSQDEIDLAKHLGERLAIAALKLSDKRNESN
jgi:NAD(P)H dehydrogenase (quinone)